MDIRDVIAQIDPMRRGWTKSFRIGNVAFRFNRIDWYAVECLRSLLRKRYGRNLRSGQTVGCTLEWFEAHNGPLPPARHHPLPGTAS